MWLIEGLPALWAAPDSDVGALIGCGKRVCALSGCPPAVHSQSAPRARGRGCSSTQAGGERDAPEARGGAGRQSWDVCSVARARDSRAHEPPPRQGSASGGGRVIADPRDVGRLERQVTVAAHAIIWYLGIM